MDVEEEHLTDLLEDLYREKGWDFRHYKKTSLQRRISKRLSKYSIPTYKAYMELLQSDPEEYDKLFSTITINASEFFRDREAFDLLREELQSLSSETTDLRIWCCGCANGEEPYSLAMLLWECLPSEKRNKARIFATDIDSEAIQSARRATYREDSLTNLSSNIREKYFFKTNGEYKVKYSLRNMIRFGKLDIIQAPSISKIDILFCRNLFIYFEKGLQEKIFKKLDYALKPGGFLAIGPAEVLPPAFASMYREVKKGSRLYRKI